MKDGFSVDMITFYFVSLLIFPIGDLQKMEAEFGFNRSMDFPYFFLEHNSIKCGHHLSRAEFA